MSSVAPSSPKPGSQSTGFGSSLRRLGPLVRRNWLLAIGFAALAMPTLFLLIRETWSTEDGAHGPIILASGIWLLAREWPKVVSAARAPGMHRAVVWLVPTLFLYLFGRVVGVLGIEMAGLMLTLWGLVFGFGGWPALRAWWFPLLYLAFLVPPPDTVVALVTQPMKLGISHTASSLLNAVGYPIANTGVTLQVGPYELLVAQACSGLNAIFSLSAIGLLYVYLLHKSDWRYALLLLLFVLPAAIFANFIRVLILVLLTYYGGDEVAQGFLHNAAGIFTFIVALVAVFAADILLSPLRKRWERA